MPTAPKSTHAGICDVPVPVPADTALTSATCSFALLRAVRQPFKWPPALLVTPTTAHHRPTTARAEYVRRGMLL